MSSRLTKTQKETYRIRPAGFANWQGQCPLCDFVYLAPDILVPQWAVYDRIRDHMDAAHPVASPGQTGKE
jgi:hypothetical protein